MASPATTRSRCLLLKGDQLLSALEELNLAGKARMPRELRDQVACYAAAIRPGRSRMTPSCSVQAHGLVLDLQAELLPAPGRPPRVLGGSHGGWLMVQLPAQAAGESTPEWRELAAATLDRAYERWAYAHYHLCRARRRRRGIRRAWDRCQLAWWNYWQLRQQVDEETQ
jgi:hypothetical protein